MYLAKAHPHARDKNILFEEGPHIYTIDGDSDYTSVTKWVHSHFPHFDPDKVIEKMMASKRWEQSKYFGMEPEAIKEMWSKNGREASAAGTKMHYDIECFYNKSENKNDSVEYGYFKEFHRDFAALKPYRTEWMIYHKQLKLAGSIDMLFENEDGSLQIYDWKRCKEIRKSNMFESASTEVVSHLPNANFWHYSLQLNTYKMMLEANYGKKVSDMFLVCLHPNKPNYQRIKVPHLKAEMLDLVTLREEQLKKLNVSHY